jgi:hypothetical protein
LLGWSQKAIDPTDAKDGWSVGDEAEPAASGPATGWPFSYTYKDCEMSNEIKVGDWTLTESGKYRLQSIRIVAEILQETLGNLSAECCEILGIDATTDSTARDICEEIVLHGTPVDEVVAKLQRHLEGGR